MTAYVFLTLTFKVLIKRVRYSVYRLKLSKYSENTLISRIHSIKERKLNL